MQKKIEDKNTLYDTLVADSDIENIRFIKFPAEQYKGLTKQEKKEFLLVSCAIQQKMHREEKKSIQQIIMKGIR